MFEMYVIGRIYTSGDEIIDKEKGNPFVTFERGTKQNVLLIAHFFGTYWLMIFLNNFNDYVCSAVTLNYYFNKDI